MRASASSISWWPATTRSSTSESPPGGRQRGRGSLWVGIVRLAHPFPSLLDAAAASAIALVAGAGLGVAVRLGLGMAFIQFAIGAANDLVDAPSDVLAGRGKPLPSGLVTRSQAETVFATCSVAGLMAAWSVGEAAAAVALAGLADGMLYDLRLKGTPMSWVPFAAGVALIPVYGWWAATGQWPPGLSAVVVLALAAGFSLASGNALADHDRDQASGVRSIATALGPGAARAANSVVTVCLVAGLLATLLRPGPGPVQIALMVVGAMVEIVGLLLTYSAGTEKRQAGWEGQAIGYALLGIGWIWALAWTGALGGVAG